MTSPEVDPRPCVVQVVPVDGIGGVEAAVRSALRPIAAMRYVMATIAGGMEVPTAGECSASRFRSPDDPRALADAIRRILYLRPDVVIGSLWRSVPVLIALRVLRPRLPLVYFLHLERTMHAADLLLSAVGLRLADEIWCDSEATRQRRLSPRQRKRSRVISFVTEHPEHAAVRPVSPTFVMWARLHHQKGVDVAIRFIAELVSRGIDARFAVYGPDGGELDALQELTRSLSLGDRVSFRGVIDGAGRAAAIDGMTFYLQLSRFEGMAMSVVEAMQAGLVPIATAVGDIPRYLHDGANGVIVDPERLPEAAERVATLLGEPAIVQRMAAAAVEQWRAAPLYRDDVADAARDLLARKGRGG